MNKPKPKRFNWRGNRPRMGKRSICGHCGLLSSLPAGSQCPQCGGDHHVEDVSYDDPKAAANVDE